MPLFRMLKWSVRPWLSACLLLTCVILVALFLNWQYHRHNFKRFAVVREGILYRSAQLSEHGLRRVAKEQGIRTVIALRQESAQLTSGLLFDPFAPSGAAEADLVTDELRASYIHWNLGSEVYYPWICPEHYDQFFKIMDSSQHQPVLVHCVAGKHRTGVFVALFRMEYDGWESEKAIEEMQSWGFGPVPRVPDHNLRTYIRRPRPTEEELRQLFVTFRDLPIQAGDDSYEHLVLGLNDSRGQEQVERALADYLKSGSSFILCLARRLMYEPDDPLAPVACELATRCVKCEEADSRWWAAAASLIADFGSPESKNEILALLADGASGGPDNLRYEMLVQGLTDRYHAGRVPLLRPLLKNRRIRQIAAARKYRYCDTAVAFLTSVLNLNFMADKRGSRREQWDNGAVEAEKWYQRRDVATSQR